MKKIIENPFVGLLLIFGAYCLLLLNPSVRSTDIQSGFGGAAPMVLWFIGLTFAVTPTAIGYFFWRLLQNK